VNYTSLKRTVAPVVEPITRADAKAAMRIDADFVDDDALVDSLVTAAREWAEKYTSRVFVEQTWRMVLPEFPTCTDRRIYLPKPPVQSVTSITYVDSAGATQTLATTEYTFIDDEHCPYIVEAYGKTWPTPRLQDDAVTVTYVAGYPKVADPLDYRINVPAPIKTAITRKLQQHLDDLRPEDHDAIETLVCGLLHPYRVSLI
jgi:uncharacterized phiE125 gp8 family phage protein